MTYEESCIEAANLIREMVHSVDRYVDVPMPLLLWYYNARKVELSVVEAVSYTDGSNLIPRETRIKDIESDIFFIEAALKKIQAKLIA